MKAGDRGGGGRERRGEGGGEREREREGVEGDDGRVTAGDGRERGGKEILGLRIYM